MDYTEVSRRFTYHAPKEGQSEIYVVIRQWARDLAEQIVSLTPESREQSLAITALEECVMWANAAVARRT